MVYGNSQRAFNAKDYKLLYELITTPEILHTIAKFPTIDEISDDGDYFVMGRPKERPDDWKVSLLL